MLDTCISKRKDKSRGISCYNFALVPLLDFLWLSLALFLWLSLSLFLTSCSSFDLIPSDSLIQRLKGRGPVLVSPDNPYLAANLLLSQEAKNSGELAGFLETKGLPSALSVSQNFLNPARLKFFYRDSLEQYELELLQGVWVINGPSSIEDETARQLLSSSTGSSAEIPPRTSPPLPGLLPSPASPERDASRKEPLKQEQHQNDPELVPLFGKKDPPQAPSPAPEESESLKKQSRIIIPAEEDQEKTSLPDQEQSLEAAIVQYASSPAETTPRGDLVHFVTSEKETLEMLTLWYTKSSKTLSRIIRANKLGEKATLTPGDQIIIPAELVKNKMRMPEEAIGHF